MEKLEVVDDSRKPEQSEASDALPEQPPATKPSRELDPEPQLQKTPETPPDTAPNQKSKFLTGCKETMSIVSLVFIIVIFILGLIIIFDFKCSELPKIVPYREDQVGYYLTVAYTFWTGLCGILFLVFCQQYTGTCAVVIKNLWLFQHVILTVAVLFMIAKMDPNAKYNREALEDILQDTPPEVSPWFIKLHNYKDGTQICCGLGDSEVLILSPTFKNKYCASIFQKVDIYMDCGSKLSQYMDKCQYMLVIFMIIISTAGLLPFVHCSLIIQKDRRRRRILQSVSRNTPQRLNLMYDKQ